MKPVKVYVVIAPRLVLLDNARPLRALPLVNHPSPDPVTFGRLQFPAREKTT